MSKAKAAGAYKHWVGVVADQKDPDELFRALAALREGPVHALGEVPAEGLAAAAESVRRVSQSVGRPVCILAAQSLHRSAKSTTADLLLAVLDGRVDPPLLYQRAPAFADSAYALFNDLQSVFDLTRRRDGETWKRRMEELGSSAWAALPKALRDLLDPLSGIDVLISGDSYWAAFPWEALRYGSGVEDYLGWQRPLARWSTLTAAATSKLARSYRTSHPKRIEVICPWDADPERLLPASREEAESLGRDLPSLGFELAPTGQAVGANANLAAMTAAVLSQPPVLHYTGHGGIVSEEEVLLLYGKMFGRSELNELKQRQGITGPLFANESLVILNSCLTGREREYGGQRKDLVGMFLEEGSRAVVASSLPVFDRVGHVLGTALYALPGACAMADKLQQIRRVIGRLAGKHNSAQFPTWSMLQYHGNP
ncbi:MAG: CHAT domain-containing protein [Terriglobia bacterium]|jgi:hypothetical protein